MSGWIEARMLEEVKQDWSPPAQQPHALDRVIDPIRFLTAAARLST